MNLNSALDGLRVTGCEKAYALNVQTRTTRYVGTNIGRDYNGELERTGQAPLSTYEIPFTIDVEAFFETTPVELDYKSGQSIGDPAEHWQRRVCATGLMLYYDASTAISRVAYIWDSGEIKHDGHEFTLFDAEEYCDQLKSAIDNVLAAKSLLASGIMPPVSPSDEACAYCPAMTYCPYWMNTAKAMLGKLTEITQGPHLTALTPEEMGQVWELAKQAEKLLEPVLKGLKKIAAEKPIPIGDKYEVRPVERSRSYEDTDAMRGELVKALAKLGMSDEDIEKKLASFKGKTVYPEFRKQKRLPMAS